MLFVKKQIDEKEPYIIAHKAGAYNYYCKNHIEKSKEFIEYYWENIDIKKIIYIK